MLFRSLPLDRLSGGRQGDSDHRAQGAGDQRPTRPRDREVHGDLASGAAGEGAGGGRDAIIWLYSVRQGNSITDKLELNS